MGPVPRQSVLLMQPPLTGKGQCSGRVVWQPRGLFPCQGSPWLAACCNSDARGRERSRLCCDAATADAARAWCGRWDVPSMHSAQIMRTHRDRAAMQQSRQTVGGLHWWAHLLLLRIGVGWCRCPPVGPRLLRRLVQKIALHAARCTKAAPARHRGCCSSGGVGIFLFNWLPVLNVDHLPHVCALYSA